MAAFAAPEPVRITFSESTCRLTRVCGVETTLMLPWPAVKAFRRSGARAPWLACTPEFAIVTDAGLAVRTELRAEGARDEAGAGTAATIDIDGLRSIHRFCLTFPDAVRHAVAAFPERHWELLSWAARTGPAADELLASNPALAFAIACGIALCPFAPAGRFRETQFLLAYHAQREVMDRLGFPATERARRILRKIQPRAVSVAGLAGLRPRLHDPEVAKRLAHVPQVNGGVLAMAVNGTITQMSPAALREVAAERAEGEAADTARRLAEAVRLWGLVRPTAQLPVFGRVDRVRELHEELREDVQRLAGLAAPAPAARPASRAPLMPFAPVAPAAGPAPVLPARRRGSARRFAALPEDERRDASAKPSPVPGNFPPPPIAGTATIVPVLTMAMLVEEGRLQRNCVADYAGAIAGGRMAVYRVLSPQRCTLSLVPSHGIWVIDQLKASCNRAPSGKTARAVMEWVRQAPAPGWNARPPAPGERTAERPQAALPW